jgi:hypothetical protein
MIGYLEDNHSTLEPWAAVQIRELISMDSVCHSSPCGRPADRQALLKLLELPVNTGMGTLTNSTNGI